MSPPTSYTPTQEAAPEHIGRAGTLPRHLRDEIARRFMAAFPGMTGATAVRYARGVIADGDRWLSRPREVEADHADALASGGFTDAREVVVDVFRAWFAGRGDLIRTRGKVRHAWAVSS